jgi:peptide/nickel transport system substrate-binding protein
VLKVAIAGDENNITPFTYTGKSGEAPQLLGLIYDTLFEPSYQVNPRPWLALGAQMSPDGRTWTVKIRTGVHWSDGQLLTADDVAFTYNYFKSQQQGRYSHHVNDQPFLTAADVVAPDSVRFTCRDACPTFNIDPMEDFPILPQHIWQNVTNPAKFTQSLPVGSGPYRIVQHVPDQLYVLKANPDYFKGRPTVDEIDLPIITDASTMLLALRTGQVDTASESVPFEDVATLKASGVNIVDMNDYLSTYISFNNERYPFTLPQFRKALNLATDTASITRTLFGSLATPGVESFLGPGVPWTNTSLHHVYDPQMAAKMLDQLGFKRQPDGIRTTPAGKPLGFQLLVSSADPRNIRAAQLSAGDLAKAGVPVTVTVLDPATLSKRTTPVNAPKLVPLATATGDYDMRLTTGGGGHFDFDPASLYYNYHCPGTTGFGAYEGGYCNHQFDPLVDRAAVSNVSDLTPLLKKAQTILYNDPPNIVLFFPNGVYGYRPNSYSGWIEDKGFGIFNKDSLLPGPRPALTSLAGSTKSGQSAARYVIGAVVVVVVLGLGTFGVLRSRRRRQLSSGSQLEGPEAQ